MLASCVPCGIIVLSVEVDTKGMFMKHTGHKVGDLVVCDFPTDYGQAMARTDKGIIIDTRESPFGSLELKVRWDEDSEIIWMRCPNNLKIISAGGQ